MIKTTYTCEECKKEYDKHNRIIPYGLFEIHISPKKSHTFSSKYAESTELCIPCLNKMLKAGIEEETLVEEEE